MATFFLVAFGGGVVVGLMVLWNNNDGQSFLPNSPLVSVSYAEPTGGGGEGGANNVSSSDAFAAGGANEPPAAAAARLLCSKRLPSPSMSLPPMLRK
jgi:hypothetical protein